MHRSHNRVIGPSLGERSYGREKAGGSVKIFRENLLLFKVVNFFLFYFKAKDNFVLRNPLKR